MQFHIAPVEADRLIHAVRTRIERRLNAPSAMEGGKLSSSGLRELAESVNAAAARVGTLPPEPPTFRARVGSVLVRIVRRMLFWYTPQVAAVQALTGRALISQAEQLDRMTAAINQLLEEQRKDQLLEEQRTAAINRLLEEQRNMAAFVEKLQLAAREVPGRLADLRERQQQLGAALVQQEHRLSVLSEHVRGAVGRPGISESALEQKRRDADRLYLAFENEFRGSQEEIAQKLTVYLPYISAAGAGKSGRPILDVGCGRGEWLSLLRGRNLTAHGVDVNSLMIGECRRNGLFVTEADAIAFLRGAPSGCMGAVTAFHIVEHLPYAVLIELIDEMKRVLKSGGIAIFETPNPANILVGAHNFYHDPTHRNPVPAALLKFLVNNRGFSDVEVLPLNPCPEKIRVGEDSSEVDKKFNEYFFGPQDYAVIAKVV